MKTNKNTMTHPELFINSAHGQYIPQIFGQTISEWFKKQIKEDLLNDISNTENEQYWDAWDMILGMTFKTPSGQKFHVEQVEDVWIIPACYARTKEYKEKWCNY